MAMYLFTKDLRLRASINTQLQKGCVSTTNIATIQHTAKIILKDPYPVLIIDEGFSAEGFLPLIEFLISSNIPGPKILIPKQKQPLSTFASEGGIAILYRPILIKQLLLCALSVSSINAIAPHISTTIMKELEIDNPRSRHLSKLVGSSKHIQEIKSIITHIGCNFSAVHINGESGTGKEIVASLLKEESNSEGPFEIVNCSNIPSSLADVYLFGSKKGAYTDAVQEQKGCVKRADGGILFLDEIEDLSLDVQGKLLRLLETNQFSQLGSDEIDVSNFRLITASNIDLKQLVAKKRLRFDLYNRINKIVLKLLPLRQRKEDIPFLIDHYLALHHDQRIIEPITRKVMLEYDWPGNVRELFNTIEMLRIFNDKEKILSSEKIMVDSIFKK